MYRDIAFDIATVLDLRRFEQHDFDLLLRNRAVFHAPRHDDEVILREVHAPVTEIHAELAPQDHEEFVLRSMIVPNEFALKLHHLHMLPVQFAHYSRVPVVVK